MFDTRKKIPDKYLGMKFTFGREDLIFTICKSERLDHYTIIWIDDHTNKEMSSSYKQDQVRINISRGTWNKI